MSRKRRAKVFPDFICENVQFWHFNCPRRFVKRSLGTLLSQWEQMCPRAFITIKTSGEGSITGLGTPLPFWRFYSFVPNFDRQSTKIRFTPNRMKYWILIKPNSYIKWQNSDRPIRILTHELFYDINSAIIFNAYGNLKFVMQIRSACLKKWAIWGDAVL